MISLNQILKSSHKGEIKTRIINCNESPKTRNEVWHNLGRNRTRQSEYRSSSKRLFSHII